MTESASARDRTNPHLLLPSKSSGLSLRNSSGQTAGSRPGTVARTTPGKPAATAPSSRSCSAAAEDSKKTRSTAILSAPAASRPASRAAKAARGQGQRMANGGLPRAVSDCSSISTSAVFCGTGARLAPMACRESNHQRSVRSTTPLKAISITRTAETSTVLPARKVPAAVFIWLFLPALPPGSSVTG